MVKSIKLIDLKIFEYINKRCRCSLLDRSMPIITSLGNLGAVWIVISLWLLRKDIYRPEGLMIISALILATIIGEGIIKHLVRRDRPFVKLEQSTLLINRPLTYSFPSGHSASSFAAAGVFVAMDGRMGIFAVILAGLIAFSRLYLRVHYPFDVITGVLLGISCSIIVISMHNQGVYSFFGKTLRVFYHTCLSGLFTG
ncbi:MAG: phosphatase PAP2 family protein [Bacillota bacterium]|nr:phosphatase PAP2 family protein [Bacillota bacterium]